MGRFVKPYRPKDIFSVKAKIPQKNSYSVSEREALGLAPLEDDIQKNIIDECYSLKYQGIRVSEIIVHIPNGGNRSKSEGAKFKKMGVTAGMPDLLVPVPRNGYGSLYIELKTKKGRIRPEQKIQMKLLEDLGNKVVLCRSVAEAIQVIKDYLGIR